MVHSTVFISSTLINVRWTISLSWIYFTNNSSQFVWQFYSILSIHFQHFKALCIVPLLFMVEVYMVKPHEHGCQILNFVHVPCFEASPGHHLVHFHWRNFYSGLFWLRLVCRLRWASVHWTGSSWWAPGVAPAMSRLVCSLRWASGHKWVLLERESLLGRRLSSSACHWIAFPIVEKSPLPHSVM